jgi:hypothetical protein
VVRISTIRVRPTDRSVVVLFWPYAQICLTVERGVRAEPAA